MSPEQNPDPAPGNNINPLQEPVSQPNQVPPMGGGMYPPSAPQSPAVPPILAQSQLPPQPMPTAYQTAPPAKSKRIPTWVKVIGIVIVLFILLIVAVVVIVNQATAAAVKVSNEFVADVQTNNDAGAYALTAPGFQKADSQAQLTKIIGGVYLALQGKATVTGKTIAKVTGQPDQAVIVYSIKTSSGIKYIQTVIQDNKTWQVLSFRSSNTPLTVTSAD